MLSALSQRRLRPDAGCEGEIGAEQIAFEVGAPKAEIGIGEGIDDGVGFKIFVADVDIPVPELLQLFVANGKPRHPANIATSKSPRLG